MLPFVSLTLCVHLCVVSVTGQNAPEDNAIIHAPCTVSRDVSHGGLRLECRHTGMTSQDLKNLVEEQATSLILYDNPIGILHNNTFQGLTNLVVLRLMSCQLYRIESSTFQKLHHLKELNLNNNNLRFQELSLPFHVFDSLAGLETLILTDNEYYKESTSFGESLNIFNRLKVLSMLYIDSFPDLKIGYEFADLRSLNGLYIRCDNLRNLYNNSLEGLRNSTVKRLALYVGNGIDYLNFNTGVFEPLPDLDLLSIRHLRIGNTKLLMSMVGLENKSIDTMEFHDIRQLGKTEATSYESLLDSYIKAEDTKYLSRVCIRHLKWTSNDVLALELDILVTSVWNTCLLSFDISENYIIKGESTFLSYVLQFQELQIFTYSMLKAYPTETPIFWDNPVNTLPKLEGLLTFILPTFSSFDAFPVKSLSLAPTVSNSSLHYSFDTAEVIYEEIGGLLMPSKVYQGLPHKPFDMTRATQVMSNDNTTPLLTTQDDPVLNISKSLTHLYIDNIYYTVIDITFKNADSLTDIYMRFSIPPSLLMKRLKGLHSLKRLDFTGSILFSDENILQYMPNLTTLVLRKTQISPDFLQTRTDRLLHHNTLLEYLDLSHNSLSHLPVGTFLPNTRLRYLCLAANRFSRIPFLLSLTPSLEILDLRSNSFTSLSHQERQVMDAHQTRVSNFTVLLAGNDLLCTCFTLSFTSWLRSTAVLFDNGGNYSCFTQDGGLSYTLMPTSADQELRRCQSRFYLMLSLTILAVMVALYTGAFFSTRYHKLVVSKILRLVTPGFRILSRKDFVYDLFIGYADQDVELVRFGLLPALEGQWELRTFVHHRDLLQDVLGFSQALRDSWRCLLILSEDFLFRCEMAHHLMKNAAFFVSAANLKKVVVVVVEERHQYSVPDYLLQVTEEDNILVVPDLAMSFPADVIETLRDRLTT